jgi:hypothetical protein
VHQHDSPLVVFQSIFSYPIKDGPPADVPYRPRLHRSSEVPVDETTEVETRHEIIADPSIVKAERGGHSNYFRPSPASAAFIRGWESLPMGRGCVCR